MARNSIPMNDDSGNAPEPHHDNTLLYQDTGLLVELLQLSYEYHQERSTLCEEAFMSFLKGFTEWLETTCAKNGTLNVDYYINSLEFHRNAYKNRWKRVPTLEPFFNAIAYLIQYGIETLRSQDYPKAYETLVQQLETLFNNEAIIHAGKQRTAYLLLEQLRQKP